MKNRIEILQWREWGDDDDTISIKAFGADEESDLRETTADENDLAIPDDNDGWRKGNMITIAHEVIEDGQIFSVAGGEKERRFRVLVEEIDEAGEIVAGLCVKHPTERCEADGSGAVLCPLCKRDEFLELIARMHLEEETDGGFGMEDAFSTLNDLIASARDLVGIKPDYPIVYSVSGDIDGDEKGC